MLCGRLWDGSDRIEKGRKVRQLLPSSPALLLLVAVQKGFDVFNALDLMENKTFLEKLKFGIGDGNLQYYLYNWKCPSMGAEKVCKLRGLPRPGSWWSKGRAWVWDPASVWALVNWCLAPERSAPSNGHTNVRVAEGRAPASLPARRVTSAAGAGIWDSLREPCQ